MMPIHRQVLGMPRCSSFAVAAFILFGTCVAEAAAPTDPSAAYPVSDSEWTLIGGGSLEQHFSWQKQVNEATVPQLALAWFADMPTADGLTGVPLVAGGVVYQSGSVGKVWANDVHTGRLLWSYDAHIKFPTGLIASWGSRLSRGLALWQDTVLKATGDCNLIALDRRTGTELWRAQTCDPMAYKTITAAPRVGAGKVFIGNANADTGIGRGYVDAYVIATGKHLWRFFTIPGDPAKGFENAAMQRASKTWGKDYWKHSGGGSAWEGITYDPVTNLVYIGTDGPSPYDPATREKGVGDEFYTNAIIAVNADTGEYVWHYSTTPGDGWNYDVTMPVSLADLTIDGRKRHVVLVAPKNGFFYVLDSHSGRLLNEPRAFVPVNWASRIDMKTGRPVLREEAKYWLKGSTGAVVYPSTMGAHGWAPMSYSPLTGLVYIPTMQAPIRLHSDESGKLTEEFYYALDHGLPFKGSLVAWDPIKQQARWQHDVGLPYEGGVLSTAGNLVFQGTGDGDFSAYRAESGEKLWSYHTGSRILGAPSTVEIDGKQLVLVAAGSGSTSGGGLMVRMTGKASGPPRLLAFSLGGTGRLPPLDEAVAAFPQPAAPAPDPALAEKGKQVFESSGCEFCHGFAAVAGQGSVPDLRRMSTATYASFSQIVRGGLYKEAGMPVFADTISEDQLPALKAYIMQEAWKNYRASPAAAH
jgi:PQQ-dependent dehydrogenase (methanol/ethanol family)